MTGAEGWPVHTGQRDPRGGQEVPVRESETRSEDAGDCPSERGRTQTNHRCPEQQQWRHHLNVLEGQQHI